MSAAKNWGLNIPATSLTLQKNTRCLRQIPGLHFQSSYTFHAQSMTVAHEPFRVGHCHKLPLNYCKYFFFYRNDVLRMLDEYFLYGTVRTRKLRNRKTPSAILNWIWCCYKTNSYTSMFLSLTLPVLSLNQFLTILSAPSSNCAFSKLYYLSTLQPYNLRGSSTLCTIGHC